MSDKPKLMFECVECNRCGGSGSYSFNMMDGSRCYGCSGQGWKLTKRGRAASDYYKALRSVKVEDLKVGDLFKSAGDSSFCRVLGVDIGNAKAQGCYANDGDYEQVQIIGSRYTAYRRAGDLVIKGFSMEEKQAMRDQALAFQATLTKAGVPMKRAIAQLEAA